MLRIACLIVIVLVVACGDKKKDKADPKPLTGSAETPKPAPDKPAGSGRSLGELTAGSAKAPGSGSAVDVAPKPVLQPVAGECTWRNDDVAPVAVCEYRCSVDDREACAIAARKYFEGDGVKMDDAMSSKLATRACDLESGVGCSFLLAGKYVTPKHIAITDKMLTFYERDCTADNGIACAMLGRIVENSDPKRSSAALKKGYELQQKACDGGDGAQCKLLAASYHAGDLGLGKNQRLAAELRKKACDHNYASACFDLSTETDKDDVRAALVDKACTLGLRAACAKLALELAGKATARAIQITDRACQLGDGESCIRKGEDLAKRDDKDKARELFERACKLGSSAGCSYARALGSK